MMIPSDEPTHPASSQPHSSESRSTSDQWSRRKLITTGLILLWSMPVITTIALAAGKTKTKSCPPGKKLSKGLCI